MEGFPWDVLLAVVGIVVPAAAFLWEFALGGRKRLGYRVQMDTPTASERGFAPSADALAQLQHENGDRLVDPSFVLLRIENSGTTDIDTDDYAVNENDRVGVRVKFPGRTVAGMVVTELSSSHLHECFGDDSGFGARDENPERPVGVIDLPRVPLNRGAHYKILAVLDRVPNGTTDEFDDPQVVGEIKGGSLRETTSRTGPTGSVIALICFLVVVSIFQLTRSLLFDAKPPPLDCASGQLVITGSTAFAPVLKEATSSYAKTCPGTSFTFDSRGSAEGLGSLNQAGQKDENPGVLAFSDGAKGEGFPRLLPRPVAFSLFTLVVNKESGVQDLSLAQIRDVYDGKIANWKDIGGKDLPVRLVDRHSDSGTRRTFEVRILEGKREPGDNSDDCLKQAPGAAPGVVRCARPSTNDVLDAIARVPGALGYSELGAATKRQDVLPVRIDGHQATLEGAVHAAYPLWETEYAYTFGEPKADSLAASFLRYLTNQVGKDIVRSHGHRPCAELANPVLCRPGT
ncbi:PstS family phosphate ABC transporter substrate-binding protein [Amycolatopsis sp. lyj-112]|uniref:PstS family phosphate ABC transporter substrate-binding protein n=1 Tax=Amycolatopsis sp. lyj-112 TaxID=2789288 RepID=UPI00397C6AA7